MVKCINKQRQGKVIRTWIQQKVSKVIQILIKSGKTKPLQRHQLKGVSRLIRDTEDIVEINESRVIHGGRKGWSFVTSSSFKLLGSNYVSETTWYHRSWVGFNHTIFFSRKRGDSAIVFSVLWMLNRRNLALSFWKILSCMDRICVHCCVFMDTYSHTHTSNVLYLNLSRLQCDTIFTVINSFYHSKDFAQIWEMAI